MTDLFIKRPVLATVISLFIFLLGLRAFHVLSVRQFPEIQNTVITVTTAYPGASADLMQGFITNPIQKSVAGADGVDYVTSDSDQGLSTVKVYVRLNADPNRAFTSVMSKVAAVESQLPQEAQSPVILKSTGQQFALMYLAFNSKNMSAEKITDYVTRIVQPALQTLPGVASAEILGGNIYAMRIWLNPYKMAAFNVTADDINQTLLQNNYQSAAGQTKGVLTTYNLNAVTNADTIDSFKKLILKSTTNKIVRIQDVATVQLGSASYDSNVEFNGQKAIFMGIFATPDANSLSVITDVRNALPKISKSFPEGLHATVAYDSTEYIRASIHEVIQTLVEATLIVVAVIFIFIGAPRAVLIPVITIPLSLVGVLNFMLFLGYSINLLTLLAMVLAIGLVVDDAIVVVENVYRHIEAGVHPFEAALLGAKEIVLPIIAMTITLATVYLPIGLLGGLTGALFKEFAFTLASTVIISGIIALTLSPMMCSKLLNQEMMNTPFVHAIDKRFHRIRSQYDFYLKSVLDHRQLIFVFGAFMLCMIAYLYTHTSQELAPQEDQSVLFVAGTAPEYANIDYTTLFSREFLKIYAQIPEAKSTFLVNGSEGVNSTFAGVILKPWNERHKSDQEIQTEMQDKVDQVAGLQSAIFSPPPLPSTDDGFPFQFVVQSLGDYLNLESASNQLLKDVNASGKFIFASNSLNFNRPQIDIEINRNKAAELGVTMKTIGNALSTLYSGGYTNRFNLSGRSYEVIPQASQANRLDADAINHLYLKSLAGTMVPLSTLIKIKRIAAPNELAQFQQLNSATIQGVPTPGVSMGEALQTVQALAKKDLPAEMNYDYGGQLREYVKEGNQLLFTMLFALIGIYLVLSAQYESFRDPFIVLTSVPMSLVGALFPLFLGLGSINIYTQVGLITLIGLIAKHGILMVDFANHLQQHEQLSKIEAIKKAASIRLRPILMTTAAMILGVLPLVFASGAGAHSRSALGIVIFYGMLIGTVFTLFVVPIVYTYLAADHRVTHHA